MEIINTNHSFQRICPTHTKFNIQFSSLPENLQELQQKVFYCQMCLIKEQVKTSSLLSIDDIISSNINQPITNWPSGIENCQIEYLSRKDSTDKKDQIKQQLIEFYSQLEISIIQSLRQSQKKQLVLLEECAVLENDLIEFYNEKFKRADLVNIFSNSNIEEADYLKLLRSMEENKDNDLKELSNKLDAVKRIESQFTQGSLSKTIQYLLEELISKIDIFSTNKSVVNQNQEQLKQATSNTEQKQDVFDSYLLKNIMKTIKSKQTSKIEESYYSTKEKVENCIKIILENKCSVSQTLESQKLVNLVERMQQNMIQFEVMKNLNSKGEGEKQLYDKGMIQLITQNTLSMYNWLTSNEKWLLQSYFLNPNILSKPNNYLIDIINQIEKTLPKESKAESTQSIEKIKKLVTNDNNSKTENTQTFNQITTKSLFDQSSKKYLEESYIPGSKFSKSQNGNSLNSQQKQETHNVFQVKQENNNQNKFSESQLQFGQSTKTQPFIPNPGLFGANHKPSALFGAVSQQSQSQTDINDNKTGLFSNSKIESPQVKITESQQKTAVELFGGQPKAFSSGLFSDNQTQSGETNTTTSRSIFGFESKSSTNTSEIVKLNTQFKPPGSNSPAFPKSEVRNFGVTEENKLSYERLFSKQNNSNGGLFGQPLQPISTASTQAQNVKPSEIFGQQLKAQQTDTNNDSNQQKKNIFN